MWKEVQKPTALDLCCSGHLLPKAPSSSSVLDLVVATPESIEVLSLGTDLESRSQRFRRRFSLRIFGAPQSIDVIRVPGRTLDSLVLSFEDAKFAVLEYSPLTDDFITTCVLSFEQQNSAENANSKVKLPFAPKIAVENRNRCAVLVVSPSKIAVIPASAMRAAVENHAQIHKS